MGTIIEENLAILFTSLNIIYPLIIVNIITSKMSNVDDCEILEISKKIMRNYFLSEPQVKECFDYWLEEVNTRGRLI